MTGGASTIVELKRLERRRRKKSEIQAPRHHFLVENSLKTLPKHCETLKNTENTGNFASGGVQ